MMSLRPRVLILVGSLALASLLAPTAASAWGGGGGAFGRHGSQRELVQRVCSEAGAPLGGMPSGNWRARWRWHGLEEGHGLSGLTEAQMKELKAACEKLGTAVKARRTADEAAFKTFSEALATARKKLDEACPALTEHHEGELSMACKEAIKTFVSSAQEAGKSLHTALEAASMTFQKALGEFETATKAIFEKLEVERIEHEGTERERERFGHFGHGSPNPGFPGGGSPGNNSQGTGNCQGGNSQGGNSQGGNSQGGGFQGGNTQGGNPQGGGFQRGNYQGGGLQGGRGGGGG
jgi:cytochrome c556